MLAFYRLAFTGRRAEELSRFRDKVQEFRDAGYEIYGMSVDSPFVQRGFAARQEANFPLLSDFNREAGRRYGILTDVPAQLLRDVCKRAVFVIEPGGRIRYKWVESEGDLLRNVDEVLEAARRTGS